MKKLVYKSLYNILLQSSNRFNNNLLTKCKIFLGTSLLIITTNSCDDPDDPQVMCYDPMPPEKTEEIQSPSPSSPTEKQVNFTNIQK